MAAEYALGDRVLMTHAISREKGNLSRTWKPYEFTRYGVVAGMRTLSNGKVEYTYYDEPFVYIPKEHFTAYLIAWDMHRVPVLALPEHLEGVGL